MEVIIFRHPIRKVTIGDDGFIRMREKTSEFIPGSMSPV